MSVKGVFGGLGDMETRARDSAKRVGAFFQKALHGAFASARERIAEIPGSVNKYGSSKDTQGGLKSFAGGMALSAIGIPLAIGAGLVAKGISLGQEAGQTHEAAARLSIASRGAGEEYVDKQQLVNEFYAVAHEIKGTTADEAAAAASKFVQMTGDLATARSSLETFAVVARATGGDMTDIAGTTAAISQQFGLTDPKQIQDVLAALVYQGKSGAFELSEAAHLFPRLLAAGASFGLKKDAQGVKTVGGIVQIARTATGSGEQASTAVENVFSALKAKSKDLAAQHVKVYEGKGSAKHVRNVTDILIDSIVKVGGKNLAKKNEKLTSIFGEQGIRALNPLISKYTDVVRDSKGTDKEKEAAGVAALKEMFDKAINAGGTWGDVVSDAGQAQQMNSAKITASFEELKQKVGDALVPAFAKIVTAITEAPELVDAFGEAAKATAEALETLIDMLYDSGIITRKHRTEDAVVEQTTDDQGNVHSKELYREDFPTADLYKQALKAQKEKQAKVDEKVAMDLARDKFYAQRSGGKSEMSEEERDAAIFASQHGANQMSPEEVAMAQGREAANMYGPEAAGMVPAPFASAEAYQAQQAAQQFTPMTGPLDVKSIGGTVKVEIVSDRTNKAGGAGGSRTPLPGISNHQR